jgi:spermidine/putrescine transport system ATP-binding protein
VILRKGKIIQMGTPAEIYDNPVSPFVQHFVGEANFFCGTIQEKNEEGSLIKCDGLKVGARPTGIPVGSEVCVGVKSERCFVIPGKEEGLNNLPGTLERELFLGRLSSVEMSSEYGKLKAKVPAEVSATIDEGDEVTLHFDREQAIVFPIPDEGLEKELEVE